MAHIHKKTKGGRSYYYIREMTRVDGKPKVVNQVYLGSIERILALASGDKKLDLKRIQVQEFGALWLANLIDKEIGLAGVVDGIVPQTEKAGGPSIGEYFLYATFNRMVSPCSKRALLEWYKGTAIQQIRPVDIQELDSDRFWRKWERVGEKEIRAIAEELFRRVSELEPSDSGCFLFDTTNYYTFMASDTDSELAQRGKNKEGRDWLRQVGLALLVARDTKLPFFYREYEGNRHDSRLFGQIMDEVMGAMGEQGSKEVTVAFDKGMNSEENLVAIDGMKNVHFVTTYSTYFAEELTHVDKESFSVVDTPKNRQLEARGLGDDRLLAWRTTGEYWGRERTVVVTYNPLTATKQRYGFEKRLSRLQAALFEIRSKVRAGRPYWRRKENILARYHSACDELHLPKNLYDLEFTKEGQGLGLGFRKNYYRIGRYIDRFGKNIIITDRADWSADQIVRASLDRYMVENAFRQTKDDDLVSLQPIRHWTDSKIRCHILTCVAALCYLRLIELKLAKANIQMSAASVMASMKRLHSCLCWKAGKNKPVRMLEEPSEQQGQILQAFGYEITNGVLQISKRQRVVFVVLLGKNEAFATKLLSDGKGLVVRLSKVYDTTPGSGTLLDGMLANLRNNNTERAASDLIFCPTHLDDVVACVIRLMRGSASTVANVAAGPLSRLDLARMAAQMIGADPGQVEALRMAELNEPFSRPGPVELLPSPKLDGYTFLNVREALAQLASAHAGKEQ